MHTQACNRHTYSYTRTNTDVDNKHTLVHCLDLTSGIDAVWSIALAPLTSHAPATVKKMPVAQMEVWKAIKKLLALTAKCLQVYIRVLPELSPVFLVTHCFPAEVFYSSFFVLCSVIQFFFMLSLSQPLPKAASIKAVKAPQPIDSLIEYHYYQQLACTMTSVKITN